MELTRRAVRRHRRLRTGLVHAVLALVLGASCGGGSTGQLRGTTPAVVVRAPGDGATQYATEPSPEPIIGEAGGDSVERGIMSAAEARGSAMQGDGRLALLAAWTAEHLGPGGTPPAHEVVEFFARHLGLVEPVPHLLILGQPDPSTLEQSIADSVSQFLDRQPYNHFGATVVDRDGLTLAVVTLSSRWLRIDPLPRHSPAGQSVRLRGQLMGDYSTPVVAVAKPNGSVERFPAGAGPAFDVEIPTGPSGVYQVEMLAQGRRGDTVLANFPLYVGVDVPSSVTLGGPAGEHDGGDPAGVAAELLRLTNATRRRAGAASVELSSELNEVAGAHSRDMVEHHFVGHDSPSTGSAPDRVRAAGLRSGLVLENIGRGYSASEIHSGLLESPAHRANITNPDVTHVGIGVVAEAEGSRTAFVATEVFLRMTREIDLEGAPGRLLALINRARRARGAGPLELEPNLAEAARDGAREFFEDPGLSQQDVVDSASGSLRRFSIAFSRVGGLMVLVHRIEDASRLEPTFDPDLRYIGIGVRQGTRSDTEPNTVAVVILLAWPR